MKTALLIFIACLVSAIQITAQADMSAHGKSNTVAFGINIPVGEFSKTHIAGISLNYARSHYRFGSLKALPKKIIGFTVDGSIDYYFGKEETVAGYDHRYGGYIYLRAFGGAIYNPCKKMNIVLTGGPTLGIDKGSADAGLGIRSGSSYFFNDRIAAGCNIIFLKHHDAAALWAMALQVIYSF